MKLIGHDGAGRTIYQQGEFYAWRCDNGYYQICRNSTIPFELGDHVIFVKGLAAARAYVKSCLPQKTE